MRFLADECCDAALVRALRDGHEAVHLRDEALQQSGDDAMVTRNSYASLKAVRLI